MASENPVSPKVTVGGIVGALAPIALYVLQQLAEVVSGFEGLPAWAYTVASIVGFVVGAYVKADPARVNTVPEAEAKLQELISEPQPENL